MEQQLMNSRKIAMFDEFMNSLKSFVWLMNNWKQKQEPAKPFYV